MTSRRFPTVLVAPTAFKGTLGPTTVAGALAEGVRAAWPGAKVLERPLSDGGNGLLEAYQVLAGGVMEGVEVTGPLGEPTHARLLRRGGEVVIESAEACGLHLIRSERREPLRATTRGVGELLLAAARGGATNVVLGLGGSGTVDGGTGMARSLGWRFTGSAGASIAEGGGGLVDLHSIRAPGHSYAPRVVALCDVENPLTGPDGAARVYGPQKGASSEAIATLDAALTRLAEVIEADLGIKVASLVGSGAAGGLGAGARAFLGADLVPGGAWMFQQADLKSDLVAADLVLTGEGRFDMQSGMGKVTGRVIEAARAADLPVLLICGSVEGSVPAGVEAIDAGGRTLGEAELARLAEQACRARAGVDRL